MAGPSTDGPSVGSRRGLFVVLVAFAAFVCAGPLAAGGSASAAPRTAAADGCRVPNALSPPGGRRARFTMLLRIKKPSDVAIYAEPDEGAGGIKGRIAERDVFVINTRRRRATAEKQERMVRRLRARFPCNRIVALNGLTRSADALGSMLNLVDDPSVYALMLVWEENDWNTARKQTPSMGRWTPKFAPNRRRVRRRLGYLVRQIRASDGGEKSIGLATAHYGGWSYGKLALTLNRRSRRIRPSRQGI